MLVYQYKLINIITPEMKINYIHVKNFESFKDQIINLDKLNIILGTNASGKSNTVSIFRFM